MRTSPELILLSAADTHQLRLSVLTVPGEEYEYDYKGDNLPTTFHLGLKVGDTLVCIGSFFQNPCAQKPNANAVQLRGMATHNDHHGHGYGRQLMAHAFEESKQKGYDLMWCNARVHAIPFYEKLGFEVVSDSFMVPRVGMHKVMTRAL